MVRTLLERVVAVVWLVSVVFGGADAFGQRNTKPRGSSSPAKSDQSSTCSGGWSGVVVFSKTLKDSLESDEPGIRKDIDRIKHKTSRNYDYSGRIIVDGTNPKEPVVSTKVAFTDTDLNWGLEKVFDSCGSRESGHWFIIEGTDDRQTQARTEGPARSFYLSVDESRGTYSFNTILPDASGTYKREQHVKRSGHCQPKNNLPYDKSDNEPTTIKGESFSISGEKLDPQHPDQISGSKVWGDDGQGAVRSFIYRVTWRFTRCPAKLLITDLRFEHPKFPNFEEWKEIPDTIGTIDGNRVKVTATVLNLSGETKYADLKISETYKGDKYNYARPDEPLPEGEVSLRLEGGEEKEVELIWDSEGQSWFDDGRPHLLHRVKAELAENGQKKDEKEKPLNIAPKPLILVHGIWSNHSIWEPLYQNLLTLGHSYQWKAYPVGEKAQFGSLSTGGTFLSDKHSDSVYDNADQLARYIRYAQEQSNAWHVDMVAHSTGGLIARLYIHKLMPNVPDARPQVKHLAMLGTPNNGVPCVDVFAGKLDLFKNELKAARELTNDEMRRFNQYVVNTGGTKISALAGNIVPLVCGGLEWNDGLVTVRSATYGVADTAESNDLNHQLVDARNFGNFVAPHLITGPKRTYPLSVKSDPTDWRRWRANNRDFDVNEGSNRGIDPIGPGYSPEGLYAALFNAWDVRRRPHGPSAVEQEQVWTAANDSFSAQLKLAPKQNTEIAIPVDAAANLGITFIAGPGVSASLLNDRGVLISRSLASSPSSGQMFRMLLTLKQVSASVWKIKIENTTDQEQIFAGFSWSIEGLPPGAIPAGL